MKRKKERASRAKAADVVAPPRTILSPRAAVIGVAALVALIVVIAYAGVFTLDFVAFDDVDAIVYRAEYNPPTAATFGRLWGFHYSDIYTPLLWVGWWLLSFLGRGVDGSWSAVPFHAFNLLAHAGTASLAFLVFRRLTHESWAAVVGALAFALHPLQVESVAWVSGMKTPLSGLFALWATWHYLVFADRADRSPVEGEPALTEPRRHSGVIHLLVSAVLYLLASLTKPTVVAMPLIVAVLDRLLRARSWRTIALGLGPWLIVAAGCSVLNATLPTATGVVGGPPLWQRALVAMDSAGFYVRKVCVPFPLIPDYSRTPQWAVQSGAIWYGWLFLLPPLALAAALFRKAPWVAAGVLTFFLGGATFGLQPFNYQVYSTVADRYTYLSLLGVGVLVACGARAASRRWGHAIAYGAAAALVIVWAGLTVAQVPVWRDTITLTSHTLNYNPNSLMTYRSLVFDAGRRGDAAGAMEICRRGLEARPGDPVLLQWRGNLSLALQRPADAAASFREALRSVRADREQMLVGLAQALSQLQQFDEAERTFREAIAANPSYAPAHENLGVMYFQRGQLAAAEAEFTAALQLDPNLTTSKKALVEIRRRQGGPV